MDKRAEIEKSRNSWFLNKTTYNLIEETKHNEFKYEDKENCKNDNIMREGLITKMAGGSFGIKCDRYVMLYKYREVDKHMISKID